MWSADFKLGTTGSDLHEAIVHPESELLSSKARLESIASILALYHGILPPTINQENPDPECDLDYVPNKARKADITVAVNNSFGFGGHNAVLILKKANA